MRITRALAFAMMAVSLTCGAYQIKMSEQPSVTEQTAREELSFHLKAMLGRDADGSGPVFRICGNPRMAPEAWRVTSTKTGVELEGGLPRGVLYAVYHYLEDVCQVNWWTPMEETIPKLSQLPVEGLKLSGKPAFESRALYASYGYDDGRFASRCRISQDAWCQLSPKYGGGKAIGGPYFIHASTIYLPSAVHFKAHPEWYAMRSGKRLGGLFKPGMHNQSHQLCLTNREMRKAFIGALREWVKKDAEAAQKQCAAPPAIYDISQADTQEFCECPECAAAVEKMGQSGLYIDFANDIAAAFPELHFTISAYQYTQEVPKSSIRPRENIILTLSDTLSNNVRGVRHPENADFLRKLRDWSRLCSSIRIWDYAITFRNPRGLPYVNEILWGDDFGAYIDHGVRHLLFEIEEPMLSDCRDYKYWLIAHFMENPKADFEALSKRFAYGYYGKAGEIFLRYRKLIREAQERAKPFINMYPTALAFVHLDIPVLLEADKLMAQGEKILADSPMELRRWRLVRLSVDRAMMARRRTLMLSWNKRTGSFDRYPIDQQAVTARIEAAMKDLFTWRVKESSNEYKPTKTALENELKEYRKEIPHTLLAVPEKFKDLPSDRVFDFTPDVAQCHLQLFKMTDDPTAETGIVRRMVLDNDPRVGKIEKYKGPDQVWGIYSEAISAPLRSAGFYHFKATGSYDWYYLGTSRLSADAVFFFPWNWFLQINVGEAFDPNDEGALFDVWLNMKFTGPMFANGKKEDPNAMIFQRLVLVRK